MYPNILILLKGLGDKTEEYKRILDYRLELKHAGKKKEQAPLKLLLNSTYGLLNNQYSAINNPHLAYSICIYGQISLYVLSQRLAGIGAEIININTDGVAYCYPGEGDQIIFDEWQGEFGLTLESDFFERWFQRTVNDYVAVTDSDHIITKGGDVNKYHEPKYFANNDIRITHVALVDYLLKGVPVQDTLRKHLDDPTMYQYVLQAGHTYQGVVEASDPDTLLPTKINRVFAAKGEGIEILKKRADDGLVKFADAPSRMFLWNGNVQEILDFGKRIDLQWYYDLTMKMVKRWEVGS